MIFLIVVSIIIQAANILLISTFGLSLIAPFGFIGTVSMTVMGIIYFGWLGVLFYVPSRLIEQSAKSSAFSPAILWVTSFVLPGMLASSYLLPVLLG